MEDLPQNHLGPMMQYCSQLLRQQLDRRLRQYDLTPAQARTLLYLSHHPQDRQRELGEYLRVEPSTVNGIVERLEQKQLLQRRADQEDGRCRRLFITEKGKRQLEEMEQILLQAERQSRKDFTPQEEKLLGEFLLRMIRNLEGEELC